MNQRVSPHHQEVLAPAPPTLLIDPTTVDPAPVRIALPRLHLAGSNAHYDAHLEVGRHGLSLFLAPTAQFPTLDIDGTREQLAQLAHALTRALTA